MEWGIEGLGIGQARKTKQQPGRQQACSELLIRRWGRQHNSTKEPRLKETKYQNNKRRQLQRKKNRKKRRKPESKQESKRERQRKKEIEQ